MLSVSGARGIVGSSMTPTVAAEFAAAFASHLLASSPPAAPSTGAAAAPAPLIIVGRDSRPSGDMIQCAAVAGLLATGCRVLRLGIVPTPTVGLLIDEHRAAGGLVLTASHNPAPWNGLKCLIASSTGSGCAPPAALARAIIDRFTAKNFAYAPVERMHRPSKADNAAELHVARVLAHVDVAAIRARRFKVLLDSCNGAGGHAGALLLSELNCNLVHLNAAPTGQFAHAPEPTRENLVDLSAQARAHHAHVAFAQDPDADRLAIVDDAGTYIGEEYTLVLAALALLDEAKLHNASAAPLTLAANLSTSRMIDDVAARSGARVLRTAVGEANVVEAMLAHSCLLGGEGNGGVIWPPICLVRDSLSAMALTLQLMARKEKSLSQICSEMPAYAIEKAKIDLTPNTDMARILDAVQRDIGGPASSNRSDGLRLDFADQRAWVHVRPSNTEPIVRVIAEAPSAAAARALVENAMAVVKRATA